MFLFVFGPPIKLKWVNFFHSSSVSFLFVAVTNSTQEASPPSKHSMSEMRFQQTMNEESARVIRHEMRIDDLICMMVIGITNICTLTLLVLQTIDMSLSLLVRQRKEKERKRKRNWLVAWIHIDPSDSYLFFCFFLVVLCLDWVWKTRRQTTQEKEQEKQKSIELKNFQDARTEKQFAFVF